MAERKPGDGCKGCKYFQKSYGDGSCLYCLRTGKSRGCPPGEGCIQYKRPSKKDKFRTFLAQF